MGWLSGGKKGQKTQMVRVIVLEKMKRRRDDGRLKKEKNFFEEQPVNKIYSAQLCAFKSVLDGSDLKKTVR